MVPSPQSFYGQLRGVPCFSIFCTFYVIKCMHVKIFFFLFLFSSLLGYVRFGNADFPCSSKQMDRRLLLRARRTRTGTRLLRTSCLWIGLRGRCPAGRRCARFRCQVSLARTRLFSFMRKRRDVRVS